MADNGNTVLDGLYLLAKSLPNVKNKAKEYIIEIIGQVTSAASTAWADITGKPTTFPPESHTHLEAEITDLGPYIEEAPIDGSAYARQNAAWSLLAGGGDMLASVYDPTNIANDAFDMDNMVDGTYVKTENNFTDTEQTKLSGIETGADVTDATNVAAAGAVMEADTTTAAMSFVIDEDNMASNLDTKIPTQQSVKAYVDTNVVGISKWTTIVKAVDQTKTSDNTYANDSELSFALDASSSYAIRMFVSGYGDADCDFKYQWAYSGTISSVYIYRIHTVTGGTTITSGVNTAINVNQAGTSAADGAFMIKADIRITTTDAGTFAFQWAQNTSNAQPLTIYAGSMIEYKKE